MSWDPKAERITAKGQAARAEAEAEAIRAQAASAAEAIRAQAARDNRAADRLEAAERRADRDRRRQKRREERSKQRAAVVGAIRKYAVPVGAIGSPEIIAWSGQLGFAEKTMKLGFLAPLLPVALEGGTLYTAKLALEAIAAGKPAGKYRAATWVQAGIAAGMNYWHGSAGAAGAQVGVAYALTSLLGIAMLELTVALKAHKAGGRSAAEIRTALVRRLRYPVLSVQATAIGAARGLDVEAAWQAAWVDRYGIGPEATRRERRTARRVLARGQRSARKAARKGGLVIADGAVIERAAMVGERTDEDAPVSPRVAFMAELEQLLQESADVQGATLNLLGGPHERSHRERMSAHEDEPVSAQGDEPVSGDERSNEDDTERSSEARPSGKRERSKRRRGGRKASARDRLDQVRGLLDERPEMSGADIAAKLRIPESTARRLRAQVLREQRGEQ